MRSINPPLLTDLLFTVSGGFIERDNEKIKAVVLSRSPSAEGQRISESIGIDKMELWSSSEQISNNPQQPTDFVYSANYTLPPSNTGMLGMPRYPHPIPCRVTTEIRAYLTGTSIKGEFQVDMQAQVLNQWIPFTMTGVLEAQID